MPPTSLTPGQQRTLGLLRRDADPVVFDRASIDGLVAEARDSLAHFVDRLGDDRELFVSKHSVASVLDCEAHHVLPDEFAWSPAAARGTISHRAIQLMLTWPGEPNPTDLTDEAIARMSEEERGIGEWLDSLSDADLADTRGQTIERVTKFMEGFPPLRKEWRPMTEAKVTWPVDEPIVLSGKADLVIGAPHGEESRKVIIDLKTGRPGPRHRQDLGFYALLETLVRRVPPRKVATFYLDSGDAHTEDVTDAMLRAALRRTLDAVNALVELESGHRPPVRRPGATCRWCPLAADCDEGREWLAEADERNGR